MRVLAAVRNTLTLLSGRGVEISKDVWEREYQDGAWDYLHGLDQLARYSVLCGYLRYLRPAAALLDVGCGDGALPQYLGREHYSEYLGLDLSEQAVAAASARLGDAHTRFEAVDAANWTPRGQFDVVVFNEALYCFADPVAALRRYEVALRPDGYFIVSMYWRAGNTWPIWKNIARTYPTLHQTQLRSGAQGNWLIRVLGRPGATSAALRRAPADASAPVP